MELELAVLLSLAIVGTSIFGIFEVETAPWRRLLKWTFVSALTLGLYTRLGHAALIAPIALGLAGVTFHFWWCRRNGIHPLKATPRRRYYQLRGWTWPEGDGGA